MNRAFSTRGDSLKSRRKTSSNERVGIDAVEDSSRLLEIINRLSTRVAELEASRPQSYTEFYVDFDNSTHTLSHGIKGGIKWWVTKNETGSSVDAVPVLSTETSLSVYSVGTGRAVVRIEPSEFVEG